MLTIGDDYLRVAHTESNTELLGPFNRYVIWTHGCCFDCDGCLAENAKDGVYDVVSIGELAREIAESDCEGITVSGGEPMLQAPQLLKLIEDVRRKRDIGVILYSGFTLEEIGLDDIKLALLDVVDVLIDGRYVKELDDGRAYVGSANQIIHYLTPRYVDADKSYYAVENRRAEIKLTRSQAVLVGVPSNEVLNIWRDIKYKSGGMKNDF